VRQLGEGVVRTLVFRDVTRKESVPGSVPLVNADWDLGVAIGVFGREAGRVNSVREDRDEVLEMVGERIG
jgi:hypothetical protein